MGTSKFELVIEKRESAKRVSTEGITPINEQRTNDEFSIKAIEKAVLRYLENTKRRDTKEAGERIIATNKKTEIENRTLRTPEAEFQNVLLRISYQHNIQTEIIRSWIKKTLAENEKENSIRMQNQINAILSGVESCYEAVKFLEKEMKLEYGDEDTWIATNDQFDARYKVDLVAAVEGEDGFIKILYLIQVKNSKEEASEEKIKNITKTHQGYLDALPQLIGMLNKKEAAKLAEKETNLEIIDIDRNAENEKQLKILRSVLDEYIKDTENPKDANATTVYKLFKDRGGILNPFTIMGILKNLKILNADEKKEKYIKDTADKIPYTEAESIAFHMLNHTRTIINSAEIISVVMVGGKKVSENKLRHPYNTRENSS